MSLQFSRTTLPILSNNFVAIMFNVFRLFQTFISTVPQHHHEQIENRSSTDKNILDKSYQFVLVCNRGDTIQYHGGLRSRELCQAPMLLVFLTPRQALSSHPCQCFCASLKLLFFMIFVGVHEFSSRLTTFSSCRRRGSNR